MGQSWKSWGLLVVLALIWGSSFILIDRSLRTFAPDQIASLRIFIAGLCLLPVAIKTFREIKAKEWIFLFLVGLFGNLLPAYLFPKAETVLNHAFVGVLNSTVPLFTMLIAWIGFKGKVKPINIVGILLGLGGAVGLIAVDGGLAPGGPWVYWLLVIAASVLYATSTNLIKNFLAGISPIRITAFALAMVAIPAGIYFFQTDFIAPIQSGGTQAWYSLTFIVILAAVGTSLALVLFNHLVKDAGPIFASSVTYLIPIVTLLWGIFDQKEMGILHFAAMAVILAGVLLVNRK